MARNRMIKVEFWADEKVAAVGLVARLLFIGSWNFADDSGVCRANSAYLRNNIFPYDSVNIKDIEKALLQLSENSLISFGTFKGEKYFLINNFLKHQKIKNPSLFRYVTTSYSEVFRNSYPQATPGLPQDFPPKEKENENVKGNEKENENLSLEEKELEKYKTYLETVKSSGDLGSRERNFLYSFARKSKANNPIAYVLTLISNGTFKDILLEEFIRLQKEKEREKEKERPPAPILTPEEEKAQKERTRELIAKAKRWGKTH